MSDQVKVLELGSCPATQEAVIERELEGEMGCPICGRTAEDHRPEPPWFQSPNSPGGAA